MGWLLSYIFKTNKWSEFGAAVFLPVSTELFLAKQGERMLSTGAVCKEELCAMTALMSGSSTQLTYSAQLELSTHTLPH
jgi:hypothetical protein